jgi:transposase
MRIVSGLTAPMLRLARQPDPGPPLSREAACRQRWLEWHQHHGKNVSLTCRRFGISRQTFYRWQRRYQSRRLASLEDRESRPHRRRRPTWTIEQVRAVLELREQYPRWGKD